MDSVIENPDQLSVPTFRSITRDNHIHQSLQRIAGMPSLEKFRLVKKNTNMSGFLQTKDVSFKSIQLKLKLRLGVAGLGEDLHRQHRGLGKCSYCQQFETAKHFIFTCPAYTYERQCMMFDIIQYCGPEYFSMFIKDLNVALFSLLSDHDDCVNASFLQFLSRAWTTRSNLNA